MAGVGFAIAGSVLAAGGLVNSFVQAGKQNKLRREAEDQAAESLEAARKILGVNKLEGLSAPLRVYEEARQGVRQTSANVIDAARQGEARGVGSVAQQTLNASQNAERQISATQEQEILRLQELAAREDSRLQSGLANLEMMGVAGAQQAARDAQMSQMKAVSEGFEGLTKLGKTVVDYKNELIPLFKRQKTNPTEIADFSSFGMDAMSSLNMPALGMSNVQNFQQFLNPAIPMNTNIAGPTDIYNPANYSNPLTQ
tara:strand:- start:751 stop:1518 length:768 start_codon:yes stop_codon:yes gene_type:complete